MHAPLVVPHPSKKPAANQNNYFSATECLMDLRPNCVFKAVHCLEVYKKIDQFGPWRDPGGPLIGKGPLISETPAWLGLSKSHFLSGLFAFGSILLNCAKM